MIKKTVKYTDYNGVERTEEFAFNLSKAELAEMELGVHGGYTAMVQGVIDAQDAPSLIKIFKELLLKAYGKVSADGRRFMKSQELRDEFEQTEAYSQLFMELAFDDKAAAKFMAGVIPEDMQQEAAKQKAIPAPPLN